MKKSSRAMAGRVSPARSKRSVLKYMSIASTAEARDAERSRLRTCSQSRELEPYNTDGGPAKKGEERSESRSTLRAVNEHYSLRSPLWGRTEVR
ncbi:hypothetical protein PSEUDO8O_30261 [Pseudomonas sp. 8O]|nr:hypothetical protein PSEUDO8O_30261 [Pseudomonas sp. 8O]